MAQSVTAAALCQMPGILKSLPPSKQDQLQAGPLKLVPKGSGGCCVSAFLKSPACRSASMSTVLSRSLPLRLAVRQPDRPSPSSHAHPLHPPPPQATLESQGRVSISVNRTWRLVLKPVGTGGKKTVLENSHAWGHMVTEDIPQRGEIVLRVWTLHLGATPAPHHIATSRRRG